MSEDLWFLGGTIISTQVIPSLQSFHQKLSCHLLKLHGMAKQIKRAKVENQNLQSDPQFFTWNFP